ncbi:cytochrome c [Magnetovibrio sp. PR-2]|uniref:c-type cytochrome n=1 Tax=Magnetovibrio sp. PR-2 TaxID=3120356 RepID=UPI002FCDE88D
MFIKRSSLLVLLSVLVAVPVIASAHSGATGVVKERMEHMKAMGASMKTLGKMVGGQVPFDSAEVSKIADLFAAGSGEAMTKLFPEGSPPHPSEAKAEIWQKWDKFQHLADELKAQAETLSMTAKGSPMIRTPQSFNGAGKSKALGGADVMEGGPVQMPPQMAVRMNFMHLSSVCKSCHTEFREKKAE